MIFSELDFRHDKINPESEFHCKTFVTINFTQPLKSVYLTMSSVIGDYDTNKQ